MVGSWARFQYGSLPENRRNSFWRWATRPLLLAALALFTLTGCGEQAATSVPGSNGLPTVTAAPQSPSATPSTQPTSQSTSQSTSQPTSQPTSVPNSSPQPTVTPEFTTSPTLVPDNGPQPILTAPGAGLEMSQAADEPLEWSESIIVSGTASPGATVSVNGIPALPGTGGAFSAVLSPGPDENPVIIEILATAPGDQASITTAALPAGDGVENLIGTVVKISPDHPRSVAGETDITLMTRGNQVELTANPETKFYFPGQTDVRNDEVADPPIEDVPLGGRVAVSASGGQVIHLVVLPGGPANSRHFTGVVLPPEASTGVTAFLTLRDRQGNQVSAPLFPGLSEPATGTLVTAILSRPPGGGDLIISGLDTAGASSERVSAALELARADGDMETLARLTKGLAVAAAEGLTLLDAISRAPDLTLAGPEAAEMAALQAAYQQVLTEYGGGGVLLRTEGIITSLGAPNTRGREMMVESKSGPLRLLLGDQTEVWLTPAGTPPSALRGWLNEFAGALEYSGEYGGAEISVNQVDLGQRVTATYDPESGLLSRVAAFSSPRLEEDLARSLAALAEKGEMAGTVSLVDLKDQSRSVYIQDQITGGTVIFLAPPDSQTIVDGLPAALSTGITGRAVSILFDQDSGEIIELSARDPSPGQANVSGVVSSFVSKVFPGNVTILTPQGELMTFSHDQETVIRLDGRRISVSDVRMGDLVRPNTAHLNQGVSQSNDETPILTLLSLKTPGPVRLTGTVRGISNTPNGDVRETLTTDSLSIITLTITRDTRLTRGGTAVQTNSLRIGDEIDLANYDPITLEAIQLVLSQTCFRW